MLDKVTKAAAGLEDFCIKDKLNYGKQHNCLQQFGLALLCTCFL